MLHLLMFLGKEAREDRETQDVHDVPKNADHYGTDAQTHVDPDAEKEEAGNDNDTWETKQSKNHAAVPISQH